MRLRPNIHDIELKKFKNAGLVLFSVTTYQEPLIFLQTSEVTEFTPNRKVSDSTSFDTLQAFLEKANKRQWDAIQEYVQPTVTFNGQPETRDQFTQRIAGKVQGHDVRLRVDGLTSDEAAQSLAGRLITTTKDADGATFEVYDLILLFVEDCKISRFYQIDFELSRHIRAPAVPAFTTKPSKNPLSAAQIRHAYIKYIDDINTRRVHTTVAEHFTERPVAGGLTLDHAKTRAFFKNVIQPATAGLKYVVEEMVVDVEKQQLAAKLSIQGVPESRRIREHFGDDEIKLDEIALYGFTDGKISIFCGATPKGFLPDPPAH